MEDCLLSPHVYLIKASGKLNIACLKYNTTPENQEMMDRKPYIPNGWSSQKVIPVVIDGTVCNTLSALSPTAGLILSVGIEITKPSMSLHLLAVPILVDYWYGGERWCCVIHRPVSCWINIRNAFYTGHKTGSAAVDAWGLGRTVRFYFKKVECK